MQIIVNVSPKWGIGKDNGLLARIHADMRRFRSFTTGNTIVFGRKTLATFPNGKPLPNRRNIVLTRGDLPCQDNLTVCHDLSELKAEISRLDPSSVFVCGGEQIYRLLLPYCSKALVTLTYTDSEADRFFPNLNQLPDWTLTSVGEVMTEEEISFRFLEYENSAVRDL